MVDIELALGMFSPETETAIRRFEMFMEEKAEDLGMKVYRAGKLTDQEAKLAILLYPCITMTVPTMH